MLSHEALKSTAIDMFCVSKLLQQRSQKKVPRKSTGEWKRLTKMGEYAFNLPSKLIHTLLSTLHKHDTVSLSRSCKILYNKTVIYVYYAIRWHWDPRICTLLLRTLIENPEIGHYVKHIGFRYYFTDSYNDYIYKAS